MKSNNYKVIGFISLVTSGIIYTLERFVTAMSTSIVQAGFFSGQMTGGVPGVETANFFDNFFVPYSSFWVWHQYYLVL